MGGGGGGGVGSFSDPLQNDLRLCPPEVPYEFIEPVIKSLADLILGEGKCFPTQPPGLCYETEGSLESSDHRQTRD